MLDLHSAQEALNAWASGQRPVTSTRLVASLSEPNLSQRSGAADVAVLLRQALRSNDESRRRAIRASRRSTLPSLATRHPASAPPFEARWSFRPAQPSLSTSPPVQARPSPCLRRQKRHPSE